MRMLEQSIRSKAKHKKSGIFHHVTYSKYLRFFLHIITSICVSDITLHVDTVDISYITKFYKLLGRFVFLRATIQFITHRHF
jgi:hypothetical protein